MFVELWLVITGQKLHESENECILCGLFEVMCPEVFVVPDKLVVKPRVI
jgi:NAD-dependent dihydropyrimidine dehydrogenase PreA subunit